MGKKDIEIEDKEPRIFKKIEIVKGLRTWGMSNIISSIIAFKQVYGIHLFIDEFSDIEKKGQDPDVSVHKNLAEMYDRFLHLAIQVYQCELAEALTLKHFEANSGEENDEVLEKDISSYFVKVFDMLRKNTLKFKWCNH
jgi:hypothetical protein